MRQHYLLTPTDRLRYSLRNIQAPKYAYCIIAFYELCTFKIPFEGIKIFHSQECCFMSKILTSGPFFVKAIFEFFSFISVSKCEKIVKNETILSFCYQRYTITSMPLQSPQNLIRSDNTSASARLFLGKNSPIPTGLPPYHIFPVLSQ